MTVSGRGTFRAPAQRPSWKRSNGGTPRTDKRADGAEKAEEVREFTCADYLPQSLSRALLPFVFLGAFPSQDASGAASVGQQEDKWV